MIFRARIAVWTLALAGVLVVLGVAGCGDSNGQPDGRAVLDRMATAYRQARAYEDQALAQLTFDTSSQHIDQTFACSVMFDRPNKLAMHFYDAHLVCDGSQLQAKLDTLPRQILTVEAPKTLSLEDVYRDRLLVSALAQGVAAGSVQLVLLLKDDPLGPILQDFGQPKLGQPQEVDGSPCYRVELEGTPGKLVMWIDQRSYLLRRMDMPVDELRGEIESQAGPITNLSLSVHYRDAKFEAPTDAAAYRLEVPAGTELVDAFKVLPKPEPLSELLGKPIGDFTFTRADGTTVTRESLAGKVVVLDFWATWCGPCVANMPNIQKLYERYRDHDRVVVLAVNVDDPPGMSAMPGRPQVSDAQLQSFITRQGWQLDVVRDLKGASHQVFSVSILPNMFVLGPDGRVQDHELGGSPQFLAALPGEIDKLLKGEDVYPDVLRRYESELRAYEGQFAPVDGADPNTAADANIQPASEPKTLRLTKLWTQTTVDDPRNVVVVVDDAGWRVLAVTGAANITELASDGQPKATHTLQLPGSSESQRIMYLRATTDADGHRYYAAWWPSNQQVHVFDADFTRLWSYPDLQTAGGVSAAAWADLAGDGHPSLNIGYYDVVGVQNVALDGSQRWWKKRIENVIAVTPGGLQPDGRRPLLVTAESEGGRILLLDAEGNAGGAIAVGRRFIRAVFADDLDGDGQTEYLALAPISPGKDDVLGIDLTGRELWNVPGLTFLPFQDHVIAGDLLGAGSKQWIVASSDGAIHVIAADGKLVDEFRYGAAITGLALADDAGPVLIVSSRGRVEALRIENAPQ